MLCSIIGMCMRHGIRLCSSLGIERLFFCATHHQIPIKLMWVRYTGIVAIYRESEWPNLVPFLAYIPPLFLSAYTHSQPDCGNPQKQARTIPYHPPSQPHRQNIENLLPAACESRGDGEHWWGRNLPPVYSWKNIFPECLTSEENVT